MLRSEYKALETKERFNLLRKKFRAEIEKLVTDIKNNESYLYLEYDYFENRTDEELEKYVLNQVDSFITADPDPRFKHEDLGALGWKILKYDGFIACWQEAAAYGYEADFNKLKESKGNLKESTIIYSGFVWHMTDLSGETISCYLDPTQGRTFDEPLVDALDKGLTTYETPKEALKALYNTRSSEITSIFGFMDDGFCQIELTPANAE